LLTRGDIISSIKGPNGGFYISDKARQLPVKAVLVALDEYVVLEKCVLGLRECSEVKPCPMHAQYKFIKPQLQRLFESRTIQSLADDIDKGDAFIKTSARKKH
jgi:Rrf2 family transcriptional regulator, iron-sulfur cluster assembly transcription factor